MLKFRMDNSAAFNKAANEYISTKRKSSELDRWMERETRRLVNNISSVNPADIQRLMDYLFSLPVSAMRLAIMITLLEHENAPTITLTRACREGVRCLRLSAANHPDCPEEDQVFVALGDLDYPSEDD